MPLTILIMLSLNSCITFFYGFPLVPLITVGQAETDLSGGILQELDVHVSCRRIFIYQIHFFRGDPVNSP